MDYIKAKLLRQLIAHFQSDDRRIEHALSVMAWTEKLLEWETTDREIALASALLHDVGIKEAEARHGYSSARLQEEYGPAIARKLLDEAGFPQEKAEIVCAIVGKHHTKNGIDSANFRVLWDSDMLVNTADAAGPERAKLLQQVDVVFATESGRRYAKLQFGE